MQCRWGYWGYGDTYDKADNEAAYDATLSTSMNFWDTGQSWQTMHSPTHASIHSSTRSSTHPFMHLRFSNLKEGVRQRIKGKCVICSLSHCRFGSVRSIARCRRHNTRRIIGRALLHRQCQSSMTCMPLLQQSPCVAVITHVIWLRGMPVCS